MIPQLKRTFIVTVFKVMVPDLGYEECDINANTCKRPKRQQKLNTLIVAKCEHRLKDHGHASISVRLR